MAQVPSEIDYIGSTAEALSHPEIETEIEVIEATGDSDEVSQTNETKKPKSPAPKCTKKGLRKAANDSDWYRALESQDFNELMTLLQANPYLMAQTGSEGRTILHAAADSGCIQLLDQVFDEFNDFRHFEDKASGVSLYLNDLLDAKFGVYGAKPVDMAWFTCSAEVVHVLRMGSRSDDKRFSSMQRSSYDASQHLKETLVEIMQREPSRKAYEDLKEDIQIDVDYNFVLEREELRFHYACQDLYHPPAMNYVKTIIGGCLELGPSKSVKVLTYLFQLHNAQGQTPLHVASTYQCIHKLLHVMPPDNVYKDCLNAKDVRGWTALHYVATLDTYNFSLSILLADERVDANTRTGPQKAQRDIIPEDEIQETEMTALHLAILHEQEENVEILLKCSRTDVNAMLYRFIECGHERDKFRSPDAYMKLEERMFWSPLQLASMKGLSHVVRALLESSELCDIYNDKKLQNKDTRKKLFPKVPALLLACASGNPDTLRLFLDNSKSDPLVKFEGATALHYATNAMIPKAHLRRRYDSRNDSKVSHLLFFSDLAYLDCNTHKYEDKTLIPTSYLGRQACITMLLQAGVGIWEKDKNNRLADPGPEAPKESLLWWHEQMARETLEAKKSLNDAANAISVVAALVATASFVGPLQPPLGYGGDSVEGGVQDTYLSVRVFMVTNILSFYFAVASIMFAVVPSLPMPQEGIYLEWQRTRRSVGVAIFFLLMSVLNVLISFGTASNSVVSEDYSWQHAGISFYPTLLGGFLCILGIGLFFIRLLRLVFHKNARIRSLYKTFVKF